MHRLSPPPATGRRRGGRIGASIEAPNDIIVSSADLREADLEGLQEFASQVGVGYEGLGEDQLRNKLILEGEPV